MTTDPSTERAQPVTDIAVFRVGLSLPCAIPVKPGTPDSTGDISERTELCHVDAWWIFNGTKPVCDRHLREAICPMLDWDYDDIVADLRANGWPGDIPLPKETVPWEQMHRYDQEPARV